MNILSYEVFSEDLRKVIGDKMKEIFLVGLEKLSILSYRGH